MFAITQLKRHKKSRQLCIVLITASLSACANFKGPAFQEAQHDNEIFNTPLRAPKPNVASDVYLPLEPEEQKQTGLEILPAPQVNTVLVATKARDAVLPSLSKGPISRLTFNNMPVPVFINEVFGNQLGLNFVIDPSLKNSADLVTMRINEAIGKKEFYSLASQTLARYGVTTSINDNALLFSFSDDAANDKIPLMVSGLTLPEVPSTTRPIFYIYPLKAVTPSAVRSWVAQLFNKNELEIKEDPIGNNLVFIGPVRAIEQAIAATELLDKPTMDGMFSRVVRPNINAVDDLAKNLENILKSEGYSVRQGDGLSAIRLLPLASVNQLVIFARSADVLNHILDWVKLLEKEQQEKIEQGLFTYQVQSTKASHIIEVLNSLGLSDAQLSSGNDRSDSLNGSTNKPSPQRQLSPAFNSQNSDRVRGKFAVDEQLNTILFSGSGKDWLQNLPVIKSLDKPAPSVLVEVIIAEITLGDKEETGVDILNATSSLGRFTLDFTTGASGLVTNVEDMFSSAIDNAGQTRATLKALSTSTKVNIRSKPRIMVKSGGEATIEVGDEISVQTSSTLSDGGNAQAQFSYRKTGVLLSVKPTVHASGFVDIEISQELSAAVAGADATNPDIRNRSLSTTVTLRDGGSVLLGGLISSTTGSTSNGVPILGKLPLIGKLFSTDTENQDRTELMIMVIPYILNSPAEAEQLTDELQKARIDKYSVEALH
jgi:general secretion pathway protein D